MSTGFKVLGQGLILLHKVDVRLMFVILNKTGWKKYANETVPVVLIYVFLSVIRRSEPTIGLGNFGTAQIDSPNMRLFKAYIRGRAWKAIGYRLLKPCYLNKDDHNRKIRNRKQRTDIGKYSFVNRTVKNWNRLPADLLAFFLRKINTFRKRVKNVVTSKRIEVGIECK